MIQTRNLRTPIQRLYGWGAELGRFAANKKIRNSEVANNSLFYPEELNLPNLEEKEYTNVASGFKHAAIGFKDGIFSFGLNTRGQLGLGRVSNNFDYGFVKVKGEIEDVCCGREHTLLKVRLNKEDGFEGSQVLGSGSSNHGQIALEKEIESNKGKKDVLFRDHFQLIKGMGNIKAITCGLDHTVVLNDKNQIYTMGWNSDGQLGLGIDPPKDQHTPTQLEPFTKNMIVKMQSFHDCTIVLDDKGNLFSWGNSEYGQGGQGKIIDRILKPTQFDLPSSIIDLASGGSSSLFLTDDGKVYTCGFGALGLGQRKLDVIKPEIIPGLENIKKIYAGAGTACALNSNGELYIWGLATPASPRLGLGPDNLHSYIPTLLKLPYDTVKVKKVALGMFYSLILAEE